MLTTINVDEPHAYFSLTKSEASLIVVHEPPKTRICGNCKHVLLVASNGLTYCNNPKTEDYLLGGLNQPIINPHEWNCPLWEAKESEGEL